MSGSPSHFQDLKKIARLDKNSILRLHAFKIMKSTDMSAESLAKPDQPSTEVSSRQLEAHDPDRQWNNLRSFIVEFSPNDPRNAPNFPLARKWLVTFITSMSVFAITLTSSAYSGSAAPVITEFDTTEEFFVLGVSLFVLGFAVGPALWPPWSELHGRRKAFMFAHVFCGGICWRLCWCKSWLMYQAILRR